MRIPLSKIYRAFPELDPFSDAECERYILQVRAQSAGVHGWVIVGAGAAGAVVSVVAGQKLVRLIEAMPGPRWRGMSVDHLQTLAFIGLSIILLFLPCLAALLTRDRLLRRALRNRLDTAKCTHCRFSLLGLPVSHGRVRCPECGSDLSLAALGLRPEDIEIRKATST